MLSLNEIMLRHVPPGMRRALKRVLLEMSAARRHHKGVARVHKLGLAEDLKINVGCGPNPKFGWVNVDLWPQRPDVFTLDLRCDLPFPDSCASMIYAEHVFEHLEYPLDARHFLQEALRILRPGGIVRLGVPDAEVVLRDYVDGEDAPFAYAREHWHPEWCDTHMHQVNYTFRQGDEHKYAYDYETLASVLSTAGFAHVTRRDWDSAIDSEERRIGTLYVEGMRPTPPK